MDLRRTLDVLVAKYHYGLEVVDEAWRCWQMKTTGEWIADKFPDMSDPKNGHKVARQPVYKPTGGTWPPKHFSENIGRIADVKPIPFYTSDWRLLELPFEEVRMNGRLHIERDPKYGWFLSIDYGPENRSTVFSKELPVAFWGALLEALYDVDLSVYGNCLDTPHGTFLQL